MDKAELLKELLSDPETIETLKKMLLVDTKTTKKRVPAKKKAAVKKKPVARKARTKKVEVEPVVEKPKRGRKPKPQVEEQNGFVDDLTEAVTEVINKKRVNLVAASKKLSKKMKDVVRQPRPSSINSNTVKRVCDCGKEFDSFGGYLCDKCLRGRSSNA